MVRYKEKNPKQTFPCPGYYIEERLLENLEPLYSLPILHGKPLMKQTWQNPKIKSSIIKISDPLKVHPCAIFFIQRALLVNKLLFC